MRNKYFIYSLVLFMVVLVVSCNNTSKPNSNIPSESGNSQYLGNPTTSEGATEGATEGQQEETKEGQPSSEGTTEGASEGENNSTTKFTSALLYNTRDTEVDYGNKPTSVDESEENGTEGGSSPTTRELVEPDVFRMRDNYLFVLNQYRGLTIVDLNEKSVVSNVPIYGYPRDLYIKDGRAYVLIGYTIRHTIENGVVKKTTGSQLYIVNIQDIEKPSVESSLSLPGDFIDSRMLGNILYAVTSNYQYYYVAMEERGEESEIGSGTESPTTSDWTVNSGSTCWITSVDLTQINNPTITDQIQFPGYGTVIQASVNAIYVAAPLWESNNTQITYIDITDPNGKILNYKPVDVPGNIVDRFKLDEWNGYLRVVSNTSGSERHTYLTIFNISDPTKIEQTSQITIPDAQGETLYATRFAGPLAYLVTYFTIDPLFVVDISDPTNPQVKGQLKVPGWSTYIEPIGNQLIGLGVDDTDGQRRVKVSWFDVSDPNNPQEVSVVSIGEGWVWSSAFNDVKAFRIFDDLIVVPFSGWNGNEYKEQLQFIRWDVESRKLVPLGAVEMKGQVSRTIEYSDYYYAITSDFIHEIKCDKTNAPELTPTLITLAEYVADVLEDGDSEARIEIVQHNENQTIEIRLVDDFNVIDSIPITTAGQLIDSFKQDNNILLILNEWNYKENYEYESYYRLVSIQKNEENTLAIQKDIKINLVPYYSWYRNWCLGCDYIPEVLVEDSRSGVPAMEVMSNAGKSIMRYYYRWYPSSENKPVMICGDTLILRGWGNVYDIILGNEIQPYEGFAVIPLQNIEEFKTVGIGYNNVVSLSEGGGKLFLTTQKYIKDITYIDNYYPVIAYYLTEINLKTLAVSETKNVPGIFASSNETGNILFLKDWQYGQEMDYYYNYELWIRSIVWEENEPVSIIDSVKMTYSWATLKIQPPYLLSLISNNTLVLEKMDIEADGTFTHRTKTEIGDVWGDFLSINDKQIYLLIDGASMLTMNTGYNIQPELNTLTALPSYPMKFRIGTKGVYLICGYSGYLFVPLTD